MDIYWTNSALEQLSYWEVNNRKIAAKIAALVNSTQMNPRIGIGKPERLKHHIIETWSRRINREHRLVYEIHEDYILILTCRYHYSK